jgi:hypothetical protein
VPCNQGLEVHAIDGIRAAGQQAETANRESREIHPNCSPGEKRRVQDASARETVAAAAWTRLDSSIGYGLQALMTHECMLIG